MTAPGLSVSAVARLLGIAPETLRTWERRYDVGPAGHTAGARRRYRPDDVDRLRRMRRLVLAGVTPADAAVACQAAAPSAPSAQAGRTGGGRVLELGPVVGPFAGAARGLARAALALDSPAVEALLRQALAREGVVSTWESLLRPVLAAAGRRWARTGEGVEIEHLLAAAAGRALSAVPTGVPSAPATGRPVLLACAPGELHTLPLQALAAGLAERGVGARLLGAATPAAALHAAVRRLGPPAVFVWSQLPDTAAPAVVRDLPALRPPVRAVVGGPGWAAAPLDDSVPRVTSLEEAVELLTAATRP